MKGQIALVNGLIHLTVAEQYFSSFAKDNPGTKGASILGNYSNRIKWIYNDLITNPRLPDEVREGIKREINGDALVIPALVEKVALLTEENRQAIETLVDGMISGERIIVEKMEGVE